MLEQLIVGRKYNIVLKDGISLPKHLSSVSLVLISVGYKNINPMPTDIFYNNKDMGSRVVNISKITEKTIFFVFYDDFYAKKFCIKDDWIESVGDIDGY